MSFDTSLATDRDMVRVLIGDTTNVAATELLADATISAILVVQTNVTLAAARCCEMIAASYARQVDTSNMSLSVSASQRHGHYIAMAQTLRNQSTAEAIKYATILPGGLTISEKNTLDSDSDARQPAFSIGMDDLVNLRDANEEE